MLYDDDNSISEHCHDYAELSAEVELESPPSSVGNEQELESRVESEENETLEEIISEGPEPDEELSEGNIEMTSAQSEVVAPTFYEGFLIKLAREVFGREI